MNVCCMLATVLSLSENGDPGPWIICTALVVVVRDPSARPSLAHLPLPDITCASSTKPSTGICYYTEPRIPAVDCRRLPHTLISDRKDSWTATAFVVVLILV